MISFGILQLLYVWHEQLQYVGKFFYKILVEITSLWRKSEPKVLPSCGSWSVLVHRFVEWAVTSVNRPIIIGVKVILRLIRPGRIILSMYVFCNQIWKKNLGTILVYFGSKTWNLWKPNNSKNWNFVISPFSKKTLFIDWN